MKKKNDTQKDERDEIFMPEAEAEELIQVPPEMGDPTIITKAVDRIIERITAKVTEEVSLLLSNRAALFNREYLALEEAALYIGVKPNYMYKLTHMRKIAHYKPSGKNCLFKRSELDAWIEANRIASAEELNMAAQAYCFKNPIGKIKRKK